MPKGEILVGSLINFRSLVYSPINEQRVVFRSNKKNHLVDSMDKKLITAYILSGITLIGCIYFHISSIYFIVAPISMLLLFLSITGSLRARLALIGFLLFFAYTFFLEISFSREELFNTIFRELTAFPKLVAYLKIEIFLGIFHYLYYTFSCVNFLTTVIAIILLFGTINIEETSSRFSEKAPLVPTAILFLLLTAFSLVWIFSFAIFNFSEFIKNVLESGFGVISFILGLIILTAYAFTAISLLKKKAVGYILAPIILIMIIMTRIDSMIYNYHFMRLLYHLEYIFIRGLSETVERIMEEVGYIFIIHYSFILILLIFGIPLTVYFILCLKKPVKSIVE
jgi:hypothetical protein